MFFCLDFCKTKVLLRMSVIEDDGKFLEALYDE